MLEKYIKQLLNENDEVVVPKLGTFVAGYAGSEISGSLVAPPSKKVHFYEKLKSDKNELLRKRVTEAEGISIFDFQVELEKMTNRIDDELRNSGSSYVSQLGTIKKKPDGSLEFEQDDDNLLDDAFGLPSLDRKPLNKRDNNQDNNDEDTDLVANTDDEPVFDRDAQKEKINEDTEKDAALYATLGDRFAKDPVEEEDRLKKEKEGFINSTSHVENPPVKSETAPPVINVEEEEEEEEERSSIVAWLIAIPILFAFAFLLYILSDPSAMASVKALLGQKPATTIVTNDTNTDPVTEVDNSTDETADASNSTDGIDNDNTENNTDTDNATDNTANNGTDPSTEYTSNSETQPEDIINNAKNRFYIVIGSFAEIENARKLRSDLQGSGVSNAKIVMYPKRGMYRVTVGDQASQREAYNQKNTLGNTYPDMWVLNY
ncbi:SPOR domain-containing protein [Bernardetia sp. ABR2-2B]|uniref:HU domain-containing protein n=1 Tax=Bernardetia sp. ABR2-2B TaxID=3127472 RepID=UPI0030D52631